MNPVISVSQVKDDDTDRSCLQDLSANMMSFAYRNGFDHLFSRDCFDLGSKGFFKVSFIILL